MAEGKSKSGAPPKSDTPPKKSDAPPPERIDKIGGFSPAAPERIDTIGGFLPALLEQEEKRADDAASPAEAIAAPGSPKDPEPPPPAEGPWPSPLSTGPAWLRYLRAIPPRLAGIAVGGVVLGALLVTSVRGCVGSHRVEDLEERVAALEQTLGVNAGGRDHAARSEVGAAADAGARISSPSRGTEDAKKAGCAIAKVAAYQAWDEALAKAKTAAAPGEAKCADLWTQAKKDACYYAASQVVRVAQAARDTVMKGGARARETVKKAKNDPQNDAIGQARAASEAAFQECQDENEL